jgi:predicted enzyme related to lactoylglutathione lyase
MSSEPRMNVVVYPVRDVEAAKKFYSTLLGVQPYVDSPYYVGFRFGDQELGLDPNGHRMGLTGQLAYLDVDDIEQRVARLLDAGATLQRPITDVAQGLLVALVKDAEGNVTGLRQAPR